MKRKVILGALVAGALIAAGAAYGIVAHSTAETQTIAACVAPDGGMRLATATGACRKNESVLTWNTVGPAGPAGPIGPAGPNGLNGANGLNGQNASDPDATTATITVNDGATKLADGEAVSAVSHEIVSPRDATGAATGKRVHKPLTVTMSVDASTPLLLNALLTNKNLSSVVLSSSSETITLTHADISDYQQHGDTVTFAFTYEKIQWTSGGSTAQEDLSGA